MSASSASWGITKITAENLILLAFAFFLKITRLHDSHPLKQKFWTKFEMLFCFLTFHSS